jgi:hypothetical protein
MRDRIWQVRNPYPKWTRAEGQWARIWLVAVVLIVAVGILSSFLKVYLVDPKVVGFRRFPEMEEVYPVALAAAQEDHADAILAIVEIVSYEGVAEETLEYETRFYFCSPTDDTWALEVGVVRRFKLLGRDAEIRRSREIPYSSVIFSGLVCDDHSIDEMAYEVEHTSEAMRLVLSEEQRENLEIMPRLMELARNEQGALVWTAVFKYSRVNCALSILLDTESGVLQSERVEFPEYWASESYWRARFVR